VIQKVTADTGSRKAERAFFAARHAKNCRTELRMLSSCVSADIFLGGDSPSCLARTMAAVAQEIAPRRAMEAEAFVCPRSESRRLFDSLSSTTGHLARPPGRQPSCPAHAPCLDHATCRHTDKVETICHHTFRMVPLSA